MSEERIGGEAEREREGGREWSQGFRNAGGDLGRKILKGARHLGIWVIKVIIVYQTVLGGYKNATFDSYKKDLEKAGFNLYGKYHVQFGIWLNIFNIF